MLEDKSPGSLRHSEWPDCLATPKPIGCSNSFRRGLELSCRYTLNLCAPLVFRQEFPPAIALVQVVEAMTSLFFKRKIQKDAVVIFRWTYPDGEADSSDNLPARSIILGVAKTRIYKFRLLPDQ